MSSTIETSLSEINFMSSFCICNNFKELILRSDLSKIPPNSIILKTGDDMSHSNYYRIMWLPNGDNIKPLMTSEALKEFGDDVLIYSYAEILETVIGSLAASKDRFITLLRFKTFTFFGVTVIFDKRYRERLDDLKGEIND